VDFGVALAFSTGLMGGFGHCIGMCGPFVAAYTMNKAEAGHRVSVLPHLFFNLGRTTTYVFIGAIMGLTGSFVNSAASLSGIQNIASVIAGAFMALMGLAISGLLRGLLSFERYNSLILKAMKALLQEPSSTRYLPLGMLVGMLPCGLSYGIFIAAAGTGNMLRGMLLSLSFGMGTAFSLILFGIFFHALSVRLRGILYRLSGLVLFAMGIYFIYRALTYNA
jgi:sulfite exporter TauE/SafE